MIASYSLAYRCIVTDQLSACSEIERIDPLHFLAGCRKVQLNQALSVLLLV